MDDRSRKDGKPVPFRLVFAPTRRRRCLLLRTGVHALPCLGCFGSLEISHGGIGCRPTLLSNFLVGILGRLLGSFANTPGFGPDPAAIRFPTTVPPLRDAISGSRRGVPPMGNKLSGHVNGANLRKAPAVYGCSHLFTRVGRKLLIFILRDHGQIWHRACYVEGTPVTGWEFQTTGRTQMKNLVAMLSVALKNLAREEGQDLVEYALVVALIAFGATAGMTTLATDLNKAFAGIGTTLNSYVS